MKILKYMLIFIPISFIAKFLNAANDNYVIQRLKNILVQIPNQIDDLITQF